jgi:sigma-B regulation protein RsbU (phosphoserine phosphatase)
MPLSGQLTYPVVSQHQYGNAMDHSNPQHAAQLLAHLQNIIRDFACSLDIDETLATTLDSLMRHLQTEAASVFLVGKDGQELVCHACAGPVDLRGTRLAANQGIVGRSVSSGSVQLVRDARDAAHFNAEVDRQTGFSTRSLLCAPLVVQDQTIGAIELINKIPSLDNPAGLFNAVDAQLLSILASSAALAIRNATMARELVNSRTLQHELTLARGIQESFLPVFDEEHPIAGINLAAKNVSGDFFDYVALPDGSYSFNIGDVSGKGMDAALLMARASSLYHCLAKTVDSPADIMGIINEELSEHTTRGMFVTMIGGRYDPATRQVILANAGHVPAIRHERNGTFTYFESRSLPLGILPDQAFEEVSFSLADASLYLYTDGLSEGLARVLRQPDDPVNLKSLIEKHCHMPRQQRLQQFAQEASRLDYSFDDLTILLIEDSLSAGTRT